MEQAPILPLITARLLLRWTLMEQSEIITGISFASQRDGSVDQCRTLAVLTLASHSTGLWAYPKPPIVSVSLPIDKADSNVVCLSMPALMSFLDQYDMQGPNFGLLQRALTSALTTLIQTRGTGSDATVYNTMQYYGESTSTTLLLEPLGLIELLRYLTICQRWLIKPSSLAYDPFLETNHIIVSRSGTMVTISASVLGASPGCMIFHKLKNLY